MKKNTRIAQSILLGLITFCAATTTVLADQLDSVLKKGVVRCGVVLDFPPIGFRDSNNNPDGLDVQMCKDLAAAMKIEHEVAST